MGLALGLGSACSPDLDPRTCDDEVVGVAEDWNAEVPVDTPECAALPAEPVIGFCLRREGDAGEDDGSAELAVEISGKIVEVGSGVPEGSCVGLNYAGNIYDEFAELAVAPEDVRWIRIDADGDTWELVLTAPNDLAPLAVGDSVRAWFERVGIAFGFGYRLDLRDAEAEPLWWFVSDSPSEPVEHAPGCLPMRLGEPVCNSADHCWRMQHHTLEIGGTTVGPHEQVVVDGLRFTNAASWFSYDATCTDYPYGHRMLAATRED